MVCHKITHRFDKFQKNNLRRINILKRFQERINHSLEKKNYFSSSIKKCPDADTFSIQPLTERILTEYYDAATTDAHEKILLARFKEAYMLSKVYIRLTFALHKYYSDNFPGRDIVFLGRDAWPFFVIWRLLLTNCKDCFSSREALLHISRSMKSAKDPLGSRVYTGILFNLYESGLTDEYISLTKNPFYVKLDHRWSAFAAYCRRTGLGNKKILLFDTGCRGTVALFAQHVLQKTLDVTVDLIMLYSKNSYIPFLFDKYVSSMDFEAVERLKSFYDKKDYEELLFALESWPHPIHPVRAYRYDDYANPRISYDLTGQKDKLVAYLYYAALVCAIDDIKQCTDL